MLTPFRSRLWIAIVALAVPAVAQPGRPRPVPVAGEQVVDLPLDDGLSQRILYDTPAHPRATLIMLPGGTGDVGVGGDGDIRRDDNFVVRTRAAWVANGYAVLIPDAIARANLRGLRSSPAYGRLVDALASDARDRLRVPVFLIGTSQGTIAAINGAAHARPGLVAGVVLTEAVLVPGRHSTETVFDADPQAVRVPALIVANRDDACDVAPPAMAARIAAALIRSPDVRLLPVSGGSRRSSRACGSLSPHGYLGIERTVIAAITDWLRSHGG